MFQSTHPQGVRRLHAGTGADKKSFNPRTRKGCDMRVAETRTIQVVSIHAPARGATH